MNLTHFETMDGRLLPGMANTALRNDCDGLEDLLATHDLDRGRFLARLAALGYIYDASIRQFRLTRREEQGETREGTPGS